MIRISGNVQGLAETASALNQLPSLLRQAGEGAMTEVLELVSETLRKDFLEGPYPQEIQSRSGSFRATWRRGHRDNIFRVQSEGSKIIGTLGSQDPRARILNDGGVIRPRTSRLLAVRSEFTKTAGGVVREKYRPSLRSLPKGTTFLRMGKPKGGRQVRGTVFEKIGTRIIPIAWLVLYVVIKGRHYVEKTLSKSQSHIPGIFSRRFQQVLDRTSQTLRNIRGR